MSLNNDTRRVSSPAATGNAGGEFEKNVDAAFLSLLLVRGIPPVLTDCAVVEVDFQNEYRNWNTDDVLVVGENGAGDRRRLITQVKRTFVVSASDGECCKTITDFWLDFNGAKFAAESDRFAIVSQRGTNTFLGHFAGLLDCARNSENAADFEKRLGTKGFVSKEVVRYCSEIQAIVAANEGRDVPQSEIWPFLKVLHAVAFDLSTSTAQTETAYKTLLALSTAEPDAIGAAEATWSALLRVVGAGMPHARSYQRADLPAELQKRHASTNNQHDHALQLLEQHSSIILDGIRTSLGDKLTLKRANLQHQLLEALESHQVLILNGPAGCGKSGIAKAVVEFLSEDHFTFCFRAEEFGLPHFDETLQRSQIPVQAMTLGGILAGQHRKVLLVESIERLLEATVREAFADLLTLLKSDASWKMILTCRDYSVDLVSGSIIEPVGIKCHKVRVHALNDNELKIVETTYPELAVPLASPQLRSLLRTPYLLDKATQMPWPSDAPLPRSERAFRDKFWREVVRRDDRAANAFPRRRHEAFIKVAVRRAKALSLFVTAEDLDATAVSGLRHDSLFQTSDASDVLVAPAHDVLEDWAILKWIEEQYMVCEGSLRQLAEKMGTYPAIRRTYRKWVSETVEHDAVVADAFLSELINESSLSPQFQDDTLVSLLQSKSSSEFLQRHAAKLFVNDRKLLRQVIQLLRVGCMAPPTGLPAGLRLPSMMLVPKGPAWECVLRLVCTRLAEFNGADAILLLGLIEESARAVSPTNQYPNAAGDIVSIAHWLLPQFASHRLEELRHRTLQIIVKLPKCQTEKFQLLFSGDPTAESPRPSKLFRKIILNGIEGMAASRDLPEIVIAALREEILLTNEDLARGLDFSASFAVEQAFGIRENTHFDGHPSSAFHGPFLHLLRYSSEQGLPFIIEVVNHSATWFGEHRARRQFVEPPIEIDLVFPDSFTRKQWSNERLWCLYRGTSMGPSVLRSVLMAFERWLLDLGAESLGNFDTILLNILRETNSAALAGVIASAAVAYPENSVETLFALFSSREYMLLDGVRRGREVQAPGLVAIMPMTTPFHRIYQDERHESNGLPHRSRDLQFAISSMILGPNRQRVYNMIDQHLSGIPPAQERSDEDRLWLRVLQKMDLREYEMPEQSGDSHSEIDADGRRTVTLKLKAAPPDVQEMVDEVETTSDTMDARIGLYMWGFSVFNRESEASYDATEWQTKLAEARLNALEPEPAETPGKGCEVYIAAVCIRDHFEQLTDDALAWSIDVVCGTIEDSADEWNELARMQRGGQNDECSAAANVICCLLTRVLEASTQERVRESLILAMTHANPSVRTYIAGGIGETLWDADPELAMHCLNVVAAEAAMIQQEMAADVELPYGNRRPLIQIEYEVATQFRTKFWEKIPDDAHRQLDVSDWIGSDANRRLLTILKFASDEEMATAAFESLAVVLVKWWDQDSNRDFTSDPASEEQRSSDTESALTYLLQEFVLDCSPAAATTILTPLLAAVERHPEDLSMIVRGVIESEIAHSRTPQFWHIWSSFADAIRQTQWVGRLDSEHAHGRALIVAIFLKDRWPAGITHWRSLDGNEQLVHDLFAALPPLPTIFEDYIRFLYNIGEKSLPGAFTNIAKRLDIGDAESIFGLSNTVYMLETLLQRQIYSAPIKLKKDRGLRESVLQLLDALVAANSSGAYQMRDDFVTPVRDPMGIR